MICELTATHYDRVEGLFKPLAFMPFCAGVLEGSHSGRVLVDDLKKPRTAFMLTRGCWGYLAGAPDSPGFLQALREALFAGDLLGKEVCGLFLSCPPADWDQQLAVLCAPRDPIEFPRRHYVARKGGYDWRASVPRGYVIRRMDRSLLYGAGREVPEDVRKMLEAIDQDADASERRCGFIATCEERVAAYAMIDCLVGDVGEIGLFTREDHRRRGLATVVSAATIEAGLKNGLSGVVWDCYEYNLGSIRLAEKLGLVHERNHTMYCLHLDEGRHLALTAWYDADRGNYDKTLQTCRRLLQRLTDVPELAYLAAARAWAAMGAPDRALDNLNLAADAGWSYAPDLESPEFGRLQGSREWQALLERVCRNGDSGTVP